MPQPPRLLSQLRVEWRSDLGREAQSAISWIFLVKKSEVDA